MLLGSGLDHLRKVKQLILLLAVHKVGQALRPAILELNKHVNKLTVVFELRVNNLNVLVVLAQEKLKVKESLFDTLSQVANRFALRWTDPPVDAFRC